MGAMRKITVEIDSDLLTHVQKFTGEGVTETIRRALEELQHKAAYAALASLQGKVKFETPIDVLRYDGE